MLSYLYNWFYRTNDIEKENILFEKLYEIKLPNNMVIEAKGLSPRNAFDSFSYKQALNGYYINCTYYDVNNNIKQI